MSQGLSRVADTTIYFVDGSSVNVPPGDTMRVQEGWVSVTKKAQRPDHPLSQAGHGRVELTTTWPSSAVQRVETIREVWT